MSEKEIWKDVVGYEGLYKVSDKGNVYSVERRDLRGRKIGGRTLRPIDNKHGYLQVFLYKNGIRKHKSVHRLVAEEFVPNPNNYLEVNHLDEDKTNNNVENLEWCTRKHNMNYGARTKKVSKKLSKKVRGVNIKTGEIITFSSTAEAGRKGYGQGNVSEACRGIYYGENLYKGHTWSYEEEKWNL